MINSIKEETVRLKFRNKIWFPLFASFRRKKLLYDDFTIISNNCWGGSVYESYGLKKMSPTVGSFFMPDDYLKFLNDLDYYLSCPLSFIKPSESKYEKDLGKYSTWGTYLIGKLDDVEIHMLHHHDEEETLSKWKSRIKRVNKKRLIVKFNDNNGVTCEHIKEFMKLSYANKLCFVSKPELRISDEIIYIHQPKRFLGDGIKSSFEPFGESKAFNITNYINAI